MKRIALLLFTIAGLSAADAMTVDPSGKVGIGTATPTSTLDVAGTATATNVIVNRATQAAATEAVRGDDPRMTNARPANGGNAATVGGLAPSAFVSATEKGAANGVATLDGSGKIPSSMLPFLAPTKGMQVFTTSGTFNVPPGVTSVQVFLLGGGGGGGSIVGGSAGGFAWASLSNLAASYQIVIGGAGGSGASNGGQSSFDNIVICGGGGLSGSGGGSATSTVGGLLMPGANPCVMTGDEPQQVIGRGNVIPRKIYLAGAASYMFGTSGAGYGSGGNSGQNGNPGICIVVW